MKDQTVTITVTGAQVAYLAHMVEMQPDYGRLMEWYPSAQVCRAVFDALEADES